MVYRFHHVHIVCRDLEGMIRFFTQVLGAELTARRLFGPTEGAAFRLGETAINVRLIRPEEEAAQGPGRGVVGYHHVGLVVDDLAQAHQELSALGYSFTKPPARAAHNLNAFFQGPEGLLIELMQF